MVGRILVGEYPTADILPSGRRTERRRVKVDRVAGRAGRVLVVGLDLDRGAQRGFWLDAFTSQQLTDPLASDDTAERTFNVEVVDSGSGLVRDVPLRMIDKKRADVYCHSFNRPKWHLRAVVVPCS
jgi:hypothetical protein